MYRERLEESGVPVELLHYDDMPQFYQYDRHS
nr:alpha/beta hydrolase [Halobacillus mangrovi]